MTEESKVLDDRKYTKEHEWVKIENGIGTIGISDYAQHALTDVVYAELPKEGEKVEAMGKLAVLESVKSVSDVYAPASGEVVEVNKALEETPGLINKSPFEEGWIAKIKVIDEAELDNLMGAEEYKKFLSEQEH